jgi:hypothetical protein
MDHSNALIETDRPGAPASAATSPLARIASPLQKIAGNMFGLDYRSLALLRIGLALCLLWVAYANAYEMRAFYTDDGVMPRAALLDSSDFHGFSLYFVTGSEPGVAILFGVQILLNIMMLVGYRTRLATVGSYLFLFSMQNRAPILLYGADLSLRLGLFWAVFLPLANRFSVDRLLGRISAGPKMDLQMYLGIAGIAFIAQVGMIYTGGALLKTGRTWQVDHTAVAYALSLEAYSRPLGQWLAHFTALTKLLTICTLYLELYGPILFILPVFSKWSRLAGIAAFASLQFGFGLCMTMGVFGAVMISLTLALLPAIFWDRFAEPVGMRLAGRFRGIIDRWKSMAQIAPIAGIGCWIKLQRDKNAIASPASSRRAPVAIRFIPKIVINIVLAFLLLTMILWNIGNIPGQPWWLPPAVDTLAFTIGLNQMWDMFAPDPATNDGWIVVAGTLRNGQSVDLMSGQSPVSFDKPPNVAGSYQSQIWMAYLGYYLSDDPPNAELFARYLRLTWDERHTGDQRLQSIEIDAMEQNVEPDFTRTPVERELVWQQWF